MLYKMSTVKSKIWIIWVINESFNFLQYIFLFFKSYTKHCLTFKKPKKNIVLLIEQNIPLIHLKFKFKF